MLITLRSYWYVNELNHGGMDKTYKNGTPNSCHSPQSTPLPAVSPTPICGYIYNSNMPFSLPIFLFLSYIPPSTISFPVLVYFLCLCIHLAIWLDNFIGIALKMYINFRSIDIFIIHAWPRHEHWIYLHLTCSLLL